MTRSTNIRLTAVVVCSVAVVVGSDAVFAQQPPPQATQQQPPPGTPQQARQCQHGNGAGPRQMIVLVLKNGDCRVDPYAGTNVIHKVHEKVNRPVMWDVCNQCGADVDVRLSNGTPTSLATIFPNANPAVNTTSGNWDASVTPGTSMVVFQGRAPNPTQANQRYDIAVKFKTEGEGGWSGADPELQIDSNLMPDQWIIVAVAAFVIAGAIVAAFMYLSRQRTAAR